MEKLNNEFNTNEKLNKSKFAKEVMNLIALNITSDQALKEVIETNENKTLLEFGKYVFFIAQENKQDTPFGSGYAMGIEEMSNHIKNYFKDENMDKKWLEHLAKEKDNKAKELEEKTKRELKEKEEQEKIKKADQVDLSNADLKQLKEIAKVYKLEVNIVPVEEQDTLIKLSEQEQYINEIANYRNKKNKVVIKKEPKVKKEVKEELPAQQSIFDLG